MNRTQRKTGLLVQRFHPALGRFGGTPSQCRKSTPYLQQGQLDAACGIYCLLMALVLALGFSRSQLSRALRSRARPSTLSALFFAGSDAHDLASLASEFAPEVDYEVLEGSHASVIANATAAALGGHPVVLGVDDAHGAYSHWVLVVGVEHSADSDLPTALLALDPGPDQVAPTLHDFNWKLLLSEPRRRAQFLTCLDSRARRRRVTCTEALIVGQEARL